MKFIKIYFLCLATGLFILQSCNKDEQATNNDEQEITKNYDYDSKSSSKVKHQLSKESFIKLSFEEQKQVWVDRLSGFLNAKISNTEKELIESVTHQLKTYKDRDDIYSDEIMKKNVLELANLMSTEKFKLMFSTFDEFNPMARYGNHIDENFVQQLKTDFEKPVNVQNSQNTSEKASAPKPDCNCRWSCGDSFAVCTHDWCNATPRGCGLFGLWSCTGKDELFPTPRCSHAEAG